MLPITLYRNAQARELDRIAIQEHGIPGFELMSRAGLAVFQIMREHWPKAQTIAVFCGAGNNAGDGYIIALLAKQAGLAVTVYSVTDTAHLKGDAFTAYHNYRAALGDIQNYSESTLIAADLIIDALLGTGLDRPVTGVYALAIAHINRLSLPVIAVDCPSGLDTDTGNTLGCAVKASATVTFIALKQGLFSGYAADYCGTLHYADLALPAAIFDQLTPSAYRVIGTPLAKRARCAHKGHFGHVLIIGGDQGYAGAVRMAGEAALRIGAGLVSIATHPAHAPFLNLTRPELMCHGVSTAEQLVPLLNQASVVVIGPGLGQSAWAKALCAATLDVAKPLIVDADGLNLLALSPCNKPHWILTPHPGEAARLLNSNTQDIQADRFTAALGLQSQYGGISVLKGAGTLIAAPQHLSVVNTGNPGMASGGMGDVLSGIIAGLLAQSLTPIEATQQGVYRHGLAADQAAAKDGERGLLASDLFPYLRREP